MRSKLLAIAVLGIFFAGAGIFTVSIRQDSAVAASGEAYLGSIDTVGFNFAPRGWATCTGQLLPISQYSALFSLLGTTYGGDGRTTFALPDLRGRTPIGYGQGPGLSNYRLGQKGGSESQTLTVLNLPAHAHGTQLVRGAPMAGTGGGTVEGKSSNALLGVSVGTAVNTASTGGSQAFSVMQPYLTVNYVICLQGVYPSRN